jgi:hypothetical protein
MSHDFWLGVLFAVAIYFIVGLGFDIHLHGWHDVLGLGEEREHPSPYNFAPPTPVHSQAFAIIVLSLAFILAIFTLPVWLLGYAIMRLWKSMR